MSKDEQNKKSRPDATASNSEISSYVDSSEKNSPAESSIEPESIAYDSSNETLIVDGDSPSNSSSQGSLN